MKVFIYDNGLNLSNYVKSLKDVKITPVLTKDLSLQNDCDALLLTGGLDVCPKYYDETVTAFETDEETDLIEFSLIKKFLISGRKIVGVCKGLQILNVYFQGTLKNVENHYIDGKDIFHTVKIIKGNYLYKVFGNSAIVNSSHKQAINELGKGLKVTAVSTEINGSGKKVNVIEAITHTKFDVTAVQFHPERLPDKQRKQFYKKAFFSYSS